MNTNDREMVGLIYAAVEDPAHWNVFLELFLADMRCTMGNLSFQFFRHRAFSISAIIGVSKEDYDEYMNGRWKGQDPWMRNWPRPPHPAGAMMASQELTPDAELEQTEVYRQFLRHKGMHYGGGLILASSDWQLSSMVVLRPKEHGPLTEAELSGWRGYAPHLLRATRLIERAVRLQSERDLLRSAMNDPYSGILLVNRSREILFANQTAERLLESGRGIRRRNGGLSGESASGDKLLEDALLRVARAQGAGIHRFRLTGGPGELPLVLMAW